MFYSNPNDHMQLTAADELIRRNWRFHKEKKIWISKTQNIKVSITIIFSRLKKRIREPEPILGLVGPVWHDRAKTNAYYFSSASKTIITRRVLFMCGMLKAGRR